MAHTWVLVIRPEMCDHIDSMRLCSVIDKITAAGHRPFMFPANEDRRALEKDAIRRKFPDRVEFTNEGSPELQELVSLARQYHRLAPRRSLNQRSKRAMKGAQMHSDQKSSQTEKEKSAKDTLNAEYESEITEKQRRRLEYHRLGQLGPGCRN